MTEQQLSPCPGAGCSGQERAAVFAARGLPTAEGGDHRGNRGVSDHMLCRWRRQACGQRVVAHATVARHCRVHLQRDPRVVTTAEPSLLLAAIPPRSVPWNQRAICSR